MFTLNHDTVLLTEDPIREVKYDTHTVLHFAMQCNAIGLFIFTIDGFMKPVHMA